MTDIFDEMRRMQEDMDRMFSSFFSRRPMLLESKSSGAKGREIVPFRARMPVTDVYETESKIIARLEIPGVDKKDIELNITEHGIEVKVEKKAEKEIKDEKKGYYHYESRGTQFYRAIPFTKEVIAEKAEAEYKNGVLKVEVPKVKQEEKKEKKKRIEIK